MIKKVPKKLFTYSDIVYEKDGSLTIGSAKGVPNIAGGESIGSPSAWFLGPRAENLELLADMVIKAIFKTGDFRKDYKPDDPDIITSNVKRSGEYTKAVENMNKIYTEFLRHIENNSTPYFSMRYQGHMLWDNTLPALAGYFATMLHNPNNVTIQASTATTPLAIQVGKDLCQMVGYPERGEETSPWANIVVDGSIANNEATWATREAKFLPLSLREMLNGRSEWKGALDVELKLCNGKGKYFKDATNWELFNIKIDDILDIPKQISDYLKYSAHLEIDEWDIWNAVIPYTMNYLGWDKMMKLLKRDGTVKGAPVILVPSTKHYSWPKASATNGFGIEQMVNIFVDKNARMDTTELSKELSKHEKAHIPVMLVVVVAGTTEEGAIDPIKEVIAMREDSHREGLDFNIHVDAAWGGYMITALRANFDNPSNPKPFLFDETVAMSHYAAAQLESICECDSATIDPHKWGYVQYPAGSVLYRNGKIRRLTTFTGAYIGGTGSLNPGDTPNVGIFGLEGSKPGASAAAVYLSHKVIRPHKDGHGKIINDCLINTKLFYLHLWDLNNDDSSPYELILLNPLKIKETEALGLLNEWRRRSKEKFIEKFMEYFREIGPDENILDFAFNKKGNTDLDEFNKLNQEIYDKFHVDPNKTIEEFPEFILTMTTFNPDEYGTTFMKSFASNVVGKERDKKGKNCLRSVVMNPYLQYAPKDFFEMFATILDKAAREIIGNKS